MKRAFVAFQLAGMQRLTRRQRSRALDRATLSLGDLNNRFDLHRHIEGERAHSDGATRMPTAIAEYLNEQVRATVDDLWVVGKFRRGVHHAEHSAEANHLIKTSGCLPQRRQQLKASVPRMLIGLFEGHVAPHLALRPRAIGIEWPCTRKEDYVSEPRRRYVVCDGRSDLRQFYPQFTQPRLWRTCGSLCAEAMAFDISDVAARPATNTVRRSKSTMASCSSYEVELCEIGEYHEANIERGHAGAPGGLKRARNSVGVAEIALENARSMRRRDPNPHRIATFSICASVSSKARLA